MKKKKSVILPGSYDPVTLGHLDIIRRAAEEYEEVYAVIFTNPAKEYTFSLEDRVKMLILATDCLDNVIVSYSNGLVIDYMREHGIDLIIKGIRNEADREYEKRQEEWNFSHGGYPTEYFIADESLSSVSSTAAREAIKEGAPLDKLLPERVAKFILCSK
ncbi:MAG: pantetheine-phosphate adenylyltransferase [Clostridia bacterium]|nr:pantetheine-phosphate adenylyltransferase [Clostridia bacterium]MBQ8720123.1 pantetheine-phosphate adenylyltransferase [Clostridia bacterium]